MLLSNSPSVSLVGEEQRAILGRRERRGMLRRSRRSSRRAGGAYRPFLHDQHFSADSSFQIGVACGRRIASSEMLARVLQRWHSTSSQPYSAFAETLLALGRIDFAARLRWLFDLLKPRAITGGANSFDHTLTRFFHSGQSLKQNKKLNSFARR
jgi:hypothetical protein